QPLGAPVGVMGLSFAGGLALMAAADARYQSDISSVIALGAYDDLARVTRFLATNEIELPDGKTGRIPAEQYGALVLVYAHIEDFFRHRISQAPAKPFASGCGSSTMPRVLRK